MAGEHGYFSERGRILQLESALASRDALINEQQEKIDLLMQPVPETHGDFPWQMVRLWVLNYTREKQQWRAQMTERDGRIARLEGVLREIRDKSPAGSLIAALARQALDDKGEG